MGTQPRPTNDLGPTGVSSTPAMHNAAVDEEVAKEGLCAQLHLPTGRLCTLQHGHPGSCRFTSTHPPSTSTQRRPS